MAIDRGAAFATPILSVGTACWTNKSEILRKCLQKKKKMKFVLKKNPRNTRNRTIF